MMDKVTHLYLVVRNSDNFVYAVFVFLTDAEKYLRDFNKAATISCITKQSLKDWI